MKKKMVYGFFIFFIAALAGAPASYAEEDFAMVNNPAGEEASDPSAFEGDSDSMPGERAPENLPMEDTPAGRGVGIDF